jgi:cell division protein FtsL
MKSNWLPSWWASVLATTLAFLMHLALVFETYELGYKVSAVRKRERELKEQVTLLQLEAATLRQVDRVEAVARGTLGMEVATPERVIMVGSGAPLSRVSGRVQ